MVGVSVLDITDGRGHLHGFAFLDALAVTIWPDDAHLRSQFLAWCFARGWLECAPPDIPMPAPGPILCGLTAGFDSSGPTWMRALGKRIQSVRAVGEMILFVLDLAVWSPKYATLAKAAEIWDRQHGRDRDSRGKPFATSRSAMFAAWSQFRSVAHFCGAWRLVVPDFQFEEHGFVIGNKKHLLRYLALADFLRNFGKNIILR